MKNLTITVVVNAQIPDDATIEYDVLGKPVAFTLNFKRYAFWLNVEEQSADGMSATDLTDEQCDARGIHYEYVEHGFIIDPADDAS